MLSEPTLILGTRKGLLVFQREAAGWKLVRHAHLGLAVSYAMYDRRTGTLWACIESGHWGSKLARSTDGGESWEMVKAPAYPEGTVIMEGFPGAENRREVPATLRYPWVLQAAGESQPGRLYLGTVPGGLFVSDDNGDSFRLVEGLWNHPSRLTGWFGGGKDDPGIHSVVVDPRDTDRVLVGISCAGVFETRDGGETWAPQNQGLVAEFLPDQNAEVGHDPHFLTACAGVPDVMWQQNHCGIFRSLDGAQSWRKISQEGGPAHFGFAIAADPNDPGVAWVVPAHSDECRVAPGGALCVCRTEDGGETWTALRNGLPQENCYDVVYRHGLDYHEDTLAFGSTTGNVYLSEDRGEYWVTVGSNLPPVYSVRFA